MMRKVLHSKIHQAVVTEARPDYSGSLTIDFNLLRECGMRASDAITIANCTTGSRFETYVFEGEAGTGIIGINGAAAHLASVGDQVIIMHYAHMNEEEYESHRPKILVMNSDNTIKESFHYEPSLSNQPI
jgi:aspartate 1-decarboxylase